MIRLTVEQLFALRDSIQAGGQAQCAVLPLRATYVHRLIIAWAKGRAGGEEYYLSIWRDAKTLEEERKKEEAGETPPYDFLNDPASMDYSHTYPVEEEPNLANSVAANELRHEGFTVPGATTGRPVPIAMHLDNQGKPYRVGPADSGHPEFGVTHGE